MKKYLLLIVLAGVFLTSCKKCKDCDIKVDLTSAYPLTDSDCQDAFGMNCEDYLTQGYTSEDDLEAIEEVAPVTGAGFSVYWDCK